MRRARLLLASAASRLRGRLHACNGRCTADARRSKPARNLHGVAGLRPAGSCTALSTRRAAPASAATARLRHRAGAPAARLVMRCRAAGHRRTLCRADRRLPSARPAAGAHSCRERRPIRSTAGDKLRVVVFGQEGITNTYVVDAGGQRHPAADRRGAGARAAPRSSSPQRSPTRLKQGYVREPHVTRRGRNLPAVLHPRRGDHARPISLRAEHDGGDGGRDRRRLCAARLQEAWSTDAPRAASRYTVDVPLNYPLRPGDTIVVKERWF